jgi:anaerobic magnesium-protoporphyrin IX monomethyl ester cyclase
MKVVLIVPELQGGTSFLQPPLGLLYASTLLQKEGYEVDVVDVRTNHLSLDMLVNKIKCSDIVFVTTSPYDQVQNYHLDHRFAYAVKTINYIKYSLPKIPLIAVGAHGTVRPKLFFKIANVDIIIKGEYDYSIVNVANAIKNRQELYVVPNVFYKKEGQIVETEINNFIYHPSISDDLFPAYDKIDMQHYFGDHFIGNCPIRRRNWGVIQGSRGCPYSCSFCHNFYGKKVRRRSAESIVEEMELLETKYNVEAVFMCDFTFTLDKAWVGKICDLKIKKGLKLKWKVETRPDLIDSSILDMMAAAGCYNIILGVESFDDTILRINNKNVDVETIFSAIEKIGMAGIHPSAFIMLGMPGETVDTINETIKNIRDLKIPYTKSIITCTPRYGTDYYKLAKAEYPFVEDHFSYLDCVKGLVANEMTPSILKNAIQSMKNRKKLLKKQ